MFYAASFKEDVTLVWDCDYNLPTVTTDATKLRQILQNLINNGIKFTEKGQVTVSAWVIGISDQELGIGASRQSLTPDSRFVEFTVADTGIGIAPEVLPTIFELFHQADSSLSRPYGGIGMGLYVVKTLTEFMGGVVELESTPGVGSTFTVTIPTAPTPATHGG